MPRDAQENIVSGVAKRSLETVLFEARQFPALKDQVAGLIALKESRDRLHTVMVYERSDAHRVLAITTNLTRRFNRYAR